MQAKIGYSTFRFSCGSINSFCASVFSTQYKQADKQSLGKQVIRGAVPRVGREYLRDTDMTKENYMEGETCFSIKIGFKQSQIHDKR